MRPLILLSLLLACGGAPPRTTPPSAPAWRPFDAGALEEARSRGALVLLSLQAGWCHFCHVMNDETYTDPEVRALLAAHFVVTREEADRRPDLVARWGLYGWPATIVLDADGRELLALRGHRSPAELLALLHTLLDDRDAGRVPGSSLPTALRGGGAPAAPFTGELSELLARTEAQVDATYDEVEDGWGSPQKYPFGALVEHALFRAVVRGEAAWGERARRSLARHVSLIDPVWGGMFQYSVDGTWDHPHFEKLATLQASTLLSLAAAIAVSDEPRWRDAGDAIVGYLGERLRDPSGAFYVSEDADVRDGPPMEGAAFYALDDAARRALGHAPRIDRHLHADVNGLLVQALARYGFVTGDARASAWAVEAADGIWASHCGDERGCAHEAGEARRHLADQAAMLAGLVELYQVTGAARHLERARALAAFVERAFVDEAGGLRAMDGGGELTGGTRPFLPGAVAARALLVLDRLDEDAGHAAAARRALAALGDEATLARQGRIVGELLLALDLAVHGTVRLTLVGTPGDPRTAALRDALRRLGEPRAVIEPVLPGASRYEAGEPAVFACSGIACSPPLDEPATLAADVRALLAAE